MKITRRQLRKYILESVLFEQFNDQTLEDRINQAQDLAAAADNSNDDPESGEGDEGEIKKKTGNRYDVTGMKDAGAMVYVDKKNEAYIYLGHASTKNIYIIGSPNDETVSETNAILTKKNGKGYTAIANMFGGVDKFFNPKSKQQVSD